MISHIEGFSVTQSRARVKCFLGTSVVLILLGMLVQALFTQELRIAAMWLLGIWFLLAILTCLVLALCLGAVSKDADRAAKQAYDDWQNKRTRIDQ